MLVEANKSRSAGDISELRLRRAGGVAPSGRLASSRPKRSEDCSLTSKAGKEPMFQFRGCQTGEFFLNLRDCQPFGLFIPSTD